MLLHRIRADIILEAVPLPCHRPGVEAEAALLTGTVEIVEDLQPLRGVQFHTLSSKRGEVGSQVRARPGEVGTGLVHVLLLDRNGDILLLRNAVAPHGLVQEHLIIFLPVLVQVIVPQRHKDRVFKIPFIDTVVVDGDLGGGSAVQAVQQLGVSQEHGLLVLPAGHKIVDVGESVHLGEGVPRKEDAVIPDALDGNDLLDLAGHLVAFFVDFKDSTQRSHHRLSPPPSGAVRWFPEGLRNRGSSARIAVPWAPKSQT